MLNQNMFKKHVDPNQLASQKPADQYLHVFHTICIIHANNKNTTRIRYSKTCVKWPLTNRQNKGLNEKW